MAPLLTDNCISEFSVFTVQELWLYPYILTTHNSSNSPFDLLYAPSTEASIYFFMNKTLNPSLYSASFPTPKYGNLHLRSTLPSSYNVVIHNVYRTKSVPSYSAEN